MTADHGDSKCRWWVSSSAEGGSTGFTICTPQLYFLYVLGSSFDADRTLIDSVDNIIIWSGQTKIYGSITLMMLLKWRMKYFFEKHLDMQQFILAVSIHQVCSWNNFTIRNALGYLAYKFSVAKATLHSQMSVRPFVC